MRAAFAELGLAMADGPAGQGDRLAAAHSIRLKA